MVRIMNDGIKNELLIIRKLNNKMFCDLSYHWKSIIKRIYPNINKNDIIRAYSFNDRHAKPDIVISLNNNKVKISIKTGHNPSMHQEYYYDFFKFLERNNVSTKTIKIISFYHFGMSKKLSNNGCPFTKNEIVTRFKDYIIFANNELNKRTDLLEKIIYRSIIIGSNQEREEIDYLYYGNVEKGFLLSKNEIYDIIMNEKKDDDLFIHFGGLIYQPSGRKVNSRDRNYSRIKWPLLCVKFYE